MILIDAIYVDNGGGTKILLDYLIAELEKTDKHIYYLLDERIKNNVQAIKPTNVLKFAKSGIRERSRFYQIHQSGFSTVLCLGVVPPTIRLNIKVFIYFQQSLYLERPTGVPFLFSVKLFLKIAIIKFLKKNADFWLVQTDLMKGKLGEKFGIAAEKILKLPFYPKLTEEITQEGKKGQYIYVSNGVPHKNHVRLIEAFSNFYKKHKRGKLVLTISEKFLALRQLIAQKQKAGIPIENVGFLSHSTLKKYYLQSEYLIFPSLAESFGLGLVEAIENGCKVIGADLPYTYAVCKPSLTFNPIDVYSIEESFRVSFFENLEPSEVKISDKIDEVISLLN
ncbi:MAG TPA: glycosyltransferase [Niabella sp.]|nr:glycosyltransferase [Niabella sp.]